MGEKDQTGRELERLVAMLERVFSGQDAEIEAPSRRLIDRDTGKKREHDVLISWDHGHHRFITAIECRDRSRPIGVPAVEAFADKCASTGVHSGVMVSSTGFTRTARAKAEARSITCMELAEVEKFDWLLMNTFVTYERQFGDMNIHLMFEGSQPSDMGVILDPTGNELSAEQVTTIIRNTAPEAENSDDEVGKVVPLRMHIKTPGWSMRDSDGTIWPIDHLLVDTSFNTAKHVGSMRSHRYAGGGKDYAVASADVRVGDVPGKFLFIRNEDDSTSVFWTADRHGGATT